MEESTQFIVDDCSSIEANTGDGIVTINTQGLKPNVEYLLKYDLYDKDIMGFDKSASSVGEGGIRCNLPYIT
jgi:hypothetical protein